MAAEAPQATAGGTKILADAGGQDDQNSELTTTLTLRFLPIARSDRSAHVRYVVVAGIRLRREVPAEVGASHALGSVYQAGRAL